jgi:hypothetical protein
MTCQNCIGKNMERFYVVNTRVFFYIFATIQGGRNIYKSISVSYKEQWCQNSERKCNDNKIAGRGVDFFNDELSINSKKKFPNSELSLAKKHLLIGFFCNKNIYWQ